MVREQKQRINLLAQTALNMTGTQTALFAVFVGVLNCSVTNNATWHWQVWNVDMQRHLNLKLTRMVDRCQVGIHVL